MNDVMLPWPGPRRRANDGSRSAPHYEIQQVFDDGSSGPLEVVPITRPPWSARAGRRGFLGAGIASSVVVSLLLTGCHDDSGSGSGSTGTGSTDTGSTGTGSANTGSTGTGFENTGSTGTGSTGTGTTGTGSTGTGSTGTGSTGTGSTGIGNTGTGNTGSGGGGYVCTCNKVCTCIPVGG